jgi:hypothetical protein
VQQAACRYRLRAEGALPRVQRLRPCAYSALGHSRTVPRVCDDARGACGSMRGNDELEGRRYTIWEITKKMLW